MEKKDAAKKSYSLEELDAMPFRQAAEAMTEMTPKDAEELFAQMPNGRVDLISDYLFDKHFKFWGAMGTYSLVKAMNKSAQSSQIEDEKQG